MTTGDTVELADADATVFHFEPEFALVMGKPAGISRAYAARPAVSGSPDRASNTAGPASPPSFIGCAWYYAHRSGPNAGRHQPNPRTEATT